METNQQFSQQVNQDLCRHEPGRAPNGEAYMLCIASKYHRFFRQRDILRRGGPIRTNFHIGTSAMGTNRQQFLCSNRPLLPNSKVSTERPVRQCSQAFTKSIHALSVRSPDLAGSLSPLLFNFCFLHHNFTYFSQIFT